MSDPMNFANLASLTSLFLLSAAPVFGQDELISLDEMTIEAGDLLYQAERGCLRVLENRDREDSRSIELVFLRLHSTSEDPGPPLVFLPGGPGNPAIPMARSEVWARFLALGDVVLLDPRGVGESGPDLSWRSDEIYPELFFSDRETAVGHMAELTQIAGDELRTAGVDLTGYDAVEMADDLEALRVALDYDRLNLMGHSWGTLVGLTAIRRHPKSIARFVSIGTAGPDELMKLPSQLDRSLRRLARLVADDPLIGKAMPDLFGAFERALAGLEEEHLAVAIPDPSNPGAMLEVMLGPFGFQLLVVAELGDTADLPVLPRLIHEVERRDTAMVAWFVSKRVRQFSTLPLLTFVARAASGASVARWERIRSEAAASPFGMARCLFSPESDVGYGDIDIGDEQRAPAAGDHRVLFVSGTLDGATPVEQAEGVRRRFPNSAHLIVEYGGHEDLMPDPEVQERLIAFLAGDNPEDLRLERAPLRFAPLEGPAPGFDHPALP
jgi:pimeloyl-ACP methyl ester carboxylesterase